MPLLYIGIARMMLLRLRIKYATVKAHNMIGTCTHVYFTVIQQALCTLQEHNKLAGITKHIAIPCFVIVKEHNVLTITQLGICSYFLP